jgi:hypothetical protein
MDKIDGLYLPGGRTNLKIYNNQSKIYELSEYAKKSIFLIEYAKSKNLNGHYFPVWGTCLGFETLFLAFSNDIKIFSKVNGNKNRLDSLSTYLF